MVLEYVAGGDLADHVMNNGYLPEDEARWIFQQVLFALEFCHRMVSTFLWSFLLEIPQPTPKITEPLRFMRAILASHKSCTSVQGVAHRDVKLENILLDGSQRPIVKLADFGLSTECSEAGQVCHDGIVGSPQYFAPEVLDTMSGGGYDAKVASGEGGPTTHVSMPAAADLHACMHEHSSGMMRGPSRAGE
jgi:serine/threonine-protein kinase SRK2